MAESMEQVLRLLGDRLEDDAPETSRFREYLDTGERERDLEVYGGWLAECLEKGRGVGSAFFRAFQDILVTLGRRLGFSVTYGRYSGRRGQGPAYDGLWESPSGEVFLLEAKASAWPLASVEQLGSYMDAIATEREVSREQVYGLYMIGHGELRPVIEQIRGSVYSPRMRVITTQDLIGLLELEEELEQRVGSSAVEMTRAILLPLESIDLGNIVRLVRDLTAFTPPERPGDGGGSREPLAKLSRSEITEMEEGPVLICPSKPDGVEFMLRHRAWGFIRLREVPRYVALYISQPESAIRFLAEVERVVDQKTAPSDMGKEYEGDSWPTGKKAMLFKPGSVWELSEAIPLGKKRRRAPQGPRTSTLSQLAQAMTLDDL